ncbi:MAG: flagellar basal body-associated FliL family protein [Planctomycetes bacterium]|nr:flagellar basal body-associated FliL family protein [Planctomycetota bacterium]
MADEEKKEDAPKEGASAGKGGDDGPSFGLVTWLILGGIILAGATGGFALSMLLAGGGQSAAVEADVAAVEETDPVKDFESMLAEQGGKSWQYDLESVVANLDEPGVTRYLRATITLKLSDEMDPEQGMLFMDEKALELRDWLTTYIAGLSLERIRGSRNQIRIKKEIRDHYNEILFPETKPFVVGIFFKDFAVQ